MISECGKPSIATFSKVISVTGEKLFKDINSLCFDGLLSTLDVQVVWKFSGKGRFGYYKPKHRTISLSY